VRQWDERAPAIMISGHGTVADAVEATRIGAFDFLEKPLARERVLLVVKNALEWSDLQRENQRYRELVGPAPRMIGSSASFQQVVQQATQVARSDVTVLLTGESGTGKELLAAHIHRESPFGSGPFVKVNCAAIPTELIESELFGHEKGAFTGAAALRRGKFELADGGTIFLDEVGDLHEEDLYYRLSVVPIRVPALRERLQDIAELVPYFLSEFCARNNFRPRTLDADAMALLEHYGWPGNVRELRNVVERMAILTTGERITAHAIPLEIKSTPPSRLAAGLQHVRDSAERDRIRQALDQTDWNVSAAARLLDTERTALHKRIRTLGLKRQHERS
jgi:two-component system nitrogen regulation response regulator NtrX